MAGNISKKLLSQLEAGFNNPYWQRGKEYYQEGLIGNIIRDGDVIRAESYGNSTYRLEINLKTGEMSCSCPCGFACKHLAALIIWLKNNKVTEISEMENSLKSKTKEELIAMISQMVKANPEVSAYAQSMDKGEVGHLIKKLWFPRPFDEASLFRKLDFMKEAVLKKGIFKLKSDFLLKLVDMRDHYVEDAMDAFIEEYLREVFRGKLSKEEKKEIRDIVEEYPFEWWGAQKAYNAMSSSRHI
ncbi:MAG: SWIM zinc finger family protein [Nanoarchaeota archaeon]|nr:SWIM zinc finger family protein [Nanoarchaeota archaeon]